RQWQELFFAKRYSEIDLSDNPDFAALAEVFGIRARRIDRREQVEDALVDLLAQPGPALLHVAIDVKANVWPLVPPNTANSTMLDSNPADQDASEENAAGSNAAQPRTTESSHALPA
ncbi:MAG: thiamine pyrophosphate-dependent enzyme, partial [Pseudoxanthomonas sp.]